MPGPYTPDVAPAMQPQALSLIRAAKTISEPNREWIHGFSYLPDPNVSGFTDDPCSESTNDLTLIGSGGVNPQASDANIPFTSLPRWVPPVHHAWDRGPAFGYTQRNYKDRAKRAIESALPKLVEAEFYTGAAAAAAGYPNISLVNGPNIVIINNGGAVSMKRALSELEQAIANTGAGSRGMIHCRVEATPQLPMVRREGNLLLTGRDTIVVSGVGYPSVPPTGQTAATATQTWMFATGMVNYREDDQTVITPDPADYPSDGAFIAAAMDRTVNDVIVRGSKIAVADWDGKCHFAVLATLDT